MKFVIFIAAFFLSFNSFAQTESKDMYEILYCDVAKFDANQNITEFIGNVSLKTDIIEFKNAEKVILSNTTQEIVVTGLDEFIFDGAIEIKDKAEKKILKYTLGEKVAYLE